MSIDFHAWDTYFYASVAGGFTWLIKNSIAQGKAQERIETTMKYYIERQTNDALERLDKGNPAPRNIVSLARKHIAGEELTSLESRELTNWLRWTGTGQNPTADSAERSAALQLLTGIRTRPRFRRPKTWWQKLLW